MPTDGPADEGSSAATANPHQADLICFSHLRWHFVTQRPQHVLSLASRDRRVFYWEEPIWHQPGELALTNDHQLGKKLEIIRELPTLWVLRPHLTWGTDFEQGQRDLLAGFLEEFAVLRYSNWYYTPMAFGFSAHLEPDIVVYDCMDELKNFLNPPPQLANLELRLLARADVVFTGGVSLYEAKRTQHANVHAFPSSIDVGHFAQAKLDTLSPPLDQATLSHPRIGFYGVVDERFDVKLLEAIAALRPAMQFVILGPVLKIDPADLPKAANIHYLGSKSYAELPAYLAGWDVAVLPFALNDATRYISPTKTPEYLAAGKRVVSTSIRDVVREYGEAGLVEIADSPSRFVDALDRALLPPEKDWQEAVAARLAQSSWVSTWNSMESKMTRAAKNRSTSRGVPLASPPVISDSASGRIDPSAKASSTMRRLHHRETYDYLIVGAGFAGSVLAERLASQLHKRVLLIDRRDHIAGNAFDFYNAEGLLIHKYGPHIFHTNSTDVAAYLSQFTKWRPYEHRVLAAVDSKLLPVPINLDTINRLYSLSLDSDGMRKYLSKRIVLRETIRSSEDIVLSRVGQDLYEKFFRNYTRKQWGFDPSQLDASVAGRIPVRFDHDDRYFSDSFQSMPLHGYTQMFHRMLDHSKITVQTGVDFNDIQRTYPDAEVIYTGAIDEYFRFRFGVLPYRSLAFRHETHPVEVFQSAPVVNYPNEHEYTRVTEFKYLTGQKHPSTSIVYEYPRADGDPYYPIPRAENAALYEKYRRQAESVDHLHFCGRLGTYRYLNMDQVVAQALSLFRRIAAQHSGTSSTCLSQVISTAQIPVAGD